MADIENNLRKYSTDEDNENLQEFICKAKSSNGTDGFLSFSISTASSPALPVTESPELIDPLELSRILTKNRFFNLPNSPRNKFSNSSVSRFGLSTLQAIEECAHEDALQDKEYEMKFNFTSQKTSPRLKRECSEWVSGRRKVKALTQKKEIKRKKTLTKKAKSPYSEMTKVSPQKLPSINKSEQTIKFLRSLSKKQ